MTQPPAPFASGIPVHCAHSAIVPLGDLKPHPSNPTRHPPKQIALYVATLRANGWRRPVTISRRSGHIVRGHGARLAAMELGLTEVPVEYQDYESEAAELADLAADNRLPELSQIDSEKLAELLTQVGDAPFVTGYDADYIAKLIEEAAPPPEYPLVARLNERHDFIVVVTDNLTDWQFLKQLAGVRTERSYKNDTVGEGRVIEFTRFLQSLRENLHSIASARGDDHHAPAAH